MASGARADGMIPATGSKAEIPASTGAEAKSSVVNDTHTRGRVHAAPLPCLICRLRKTRLKLVLSVRLQMLLQSGWNLELAQFGEAQMPWCNIQRWNLR